MCSFVKHVLWTLLSQGHNLFMNVQLHLAYKPVKKIPKLIFNLDLFSYVNFCNVISSLRVFRKVIMKLEKLQYGEKGTMDWRSAGLS